MTDGLKDVHREAIIATIAANDRVERAVLFGSRATGTNTASSDVDIALFGDRLTLTDQARLATALDELPMAQQVDLLLYTTIENRALREQIEQHGVEWYRRPQRTAQPPLVEDAGGGTPPRIERLKVGNFRALRDIELTEITPLTVLLGPNGSGKSTVFDVFAFLAECFENGLRRAWEKRGRARELKSRGGEGPILIEIAYREQPGMPLITYHLEVDEKDGRPVVAVEWLRWQQGRYGRPFEFLDYAGGVGRVISGERPDAQDERIEVPLSSPDTLAVNALGQLAENPRVVALRNFIMGWHVSSLSSEEARRQPEVGPQEHLSKTGDNLANVIQYLSDEHAGRLESIFARLRERVPKIQDVTADKMPDGRLLLQIKDAPFAEPIMARFASDGTLKMLAYLALLHDPVPPPFIGIKEPENFLHPRLLYGLAEECREAAGSTQILVTTHSPFFLNALRPEEVRVLWRDEYGYTHCDAPGGNDKVKAFMDAGAQLGDLWMEGQFGVGDPLTEGGIRTRKGGGN